MDGGLAVHAQPSRNYAFRHLPDPLPLPKLKHQGPPPKQTKARESGAKARGNSYPPAPISPFLKCTCQIATPISITKANAKKRVNNPSTIPIPRTNSVPAER